MRRLSLVALLLMCVLLTASVTADSEGEPVILESGAHFEWEEVRDRGEVLFRLEPIAGGGCSGSWSGSSGKMSATGWRGLQFDLTGDRPCEYRVTTHEGSEDLMQRPQSARASHMDRGPPEDLLAERRAR